MNEIKVKRYDQSKDSSLKAWNAADELLVKNMSSELNQNLLGIYNDRFGYLSCAFRELEPIIVANNFSQEQAISKNLEANNLKAIKYHNPLERLDESLNNVVLKVPKSLRLFEFYLLHILKNSKEDIQVVCGFMTKYFSKGMVSVAEKYFTDVTQSRAEKKARLLILSGRKSDVSQNLISEIPFNEIVYQQFWGVFSSDHIDYATQFFLENVDLTSSPEVILDLASGNGVIGNEISRRIKTKEVHLLDDSFLAIESGRLNCSSNEFHHNYKNDLAHFDDEYFDLVVSNPPFHFEHEININIPINLLRSTHRVLKTGGSLQVVANKHLNYKTRLDSTFKSIHILAQNKKFVVYKCEK